MLTNLPFHTVFLENGAPPHYRLGITVVGLKSTSISDLKRSYWIQVTSFQNFESSWFISMQIWGKVHQYKMLKFPQVEEKESFWNSRYTNGEARKVPENVQDHICAIVELNKSFFEQVKRLVYTWYRLWKWKFSIQKCVNKKSFMPFILLFKVCQVILYTIEAPLPFRESCRLCQPIIYLEDRSDF